MWDLIHSNLVLFQFFYMFVSIVLPISVAYVLYRCFDKKEGS